jgi:hypothetical protein
MTLDAKWNLGALIKDLGGPERVRSLLLAQNMRVPPIRTLYSWSSEARSPSHGVALIMALGRRLDPNFEPLKYLDARCPETVGNE